MSVEVYVCVCTCIQRHLEVEVRGQAVGVSQLFSFCPVGPES